MAAAPLMFDSAAPWDLARIKQAKKVGAIALSVYLVGTPGGMRHASKADTDLVLSQGLGVYPNWERTASYLVSCGRVGGVDAGQNAAAATKALKLPNDDGRIAIAFSWDCSVDPSLYAQCGVVADGVIAGLSGQYLFTAYGQGGLIDYFVKTGRIKPGVEGWLSMSEGFPGFNVKDPVIAAVQEHYPTGAWHSSPVPGTDLNALLDPAHLRAAWPAGSPYATEEDMTPDQANQLAHAVDLLQKLINNGGSTNLSLPQIDAHLTAVSQNVNATAADVAVLKAAVAKLQAAPVVNGPAVAQAVYEGTLTLNPKAGA